MQPLASRILAEELHIYMVSGVRSVGVSVGVLPGWGALGVGAGDAGAGLPPQAKRLTQRETTSRMDRIRFFICNSSIHGSDAFGRIVVGKINSFYPISVYLLY